MPWLCKLYMDPCTASPVDLRDFNVSLQPLQEHSQEISVLISYETIEPGGIPSTHGKISVLCDLVYDLSEVESMISKNIDRLSISTTFG